MNPIMTIPMGTATTIHWPNAMEGASGNKISNMRTNERFGGVPRSVIKPPTEAAYAIPSMRPTENE